MLCAFSFSANAQDTTFNKLIHSYSGTLGIRSLIKFSDNYYACVSQIDTPYIQGVGPKNGLGILKLNANYSIVDSIVFNSYKTIVSNIGHGFAINQQDTSFIVAGTIKDDSVHWNGYLIKFNKDLDTLWTKQIAHPDTAYADTAATPWVALRDVKVTPSGDYLIVGNYNHHCQGGRNRAFIIKMDSGGGIIWYKFVDNNIYTGTTASLMIDYIDSGFYFNNVKNLKPHIIKANKHGDILWDKLYNTNPLGRGFATDIQFLDSITIILTSSNWEAPLNQSSNLFLNIMSINRHTQTTNWEKEFATINVDSKWLNQQTSDIEITPSGKIVIGTVGGKHPGANFSTDYRANLLMLNSNGDSLWSHYYTYRNDSAEVEDMQFNDMVICDDGGILFGGSYYNWKESIFLRAWLVKTDSLGNAPGMFTVGIEEKNTLVIKKKKPLLYPNPATDNFNLRFEQSPTEDYQLSIYSVSGKLVKQQQLTAFGNEYRIDIGGLKAGVYFVRLESDGELVFSDKFVKQ